jgi:N-acetylglucosaminyldiphosphoundecaprenol N-acetyl-beta-D-mannosaminyltransferase
MEQRAEFSAARKDLLRELDDRLSATGIRQRRRAHLRHSLAWTTAQRATSILRRVIDMLLALLLLLVLSPLLLGLLCIALFSGGGIRKQERLGRWATRFQRYEFYLPNKPLLGNSNLLKQLPSLLNVVKGDMSLIGPRSIAPGEEFADKRTAWKRYNLRPGLLSLWWIRKRANIAYSSEVALDSEYVETKSVWGDLGIAARAVPAMLYSGGASNAPAQIKFLGVRIDNLTMAEASARIVTFAQAAAPAQVCFINADCVNAARTDKQYRAVLSEAQLVLADGIGIRLAGNILNQNVRENVNGTDMLPFLCAAIQDVKVKIFLLGGQPGVPEAVAKWMSEHYPELIISGVRHGYFSAEEEPAVLQHINSSSADLLLVAMGAPRQDKWIADHKASLKVGVSIGVGGLFDFYSGRIPRAPVWVRELGMEWIYRFYQEPGRMWKRYFVGNVEFLWWVLNERARNRRTRHIEGGSQ